jgi:succinoglycan biosynthesis protein ExoM
MTDRLDICICTYRRPAVAEAVASVLAQEVPLEIEVRVLVIDNDAEPTARPAIEAIAADAPLPLHYLHAPGANISLARNAALDAAESRFAAFLDDDELARPGWLAALWAARGSGADVVLGPVEPLYPEGAPGWMRAAGVHATRPVWTGGEIRTGYTCNVLIDRARPEIRALRFDPSLGRSGGEDTDYFARVAAAGGRIAYTPDAVVEEAVSPDRLDFGWLARRRYRMGQTHAQLLVRQHGVPRWRALPLAAAKALACAGLALCAPANRARRNHAILRGLLHVGVVAGLSGHATLTLYGTARTVPE